MIYFVFVLYLFLTACSPSNLEDFRCEGEALSWKLVKELQKIETRDQLPRALPILKKHFASLAKLMIEAQKFQRSHEPSLDNSFTPSTASQALRQELERIYAWDNGRTLIEEAQHPALLELSRSQP